jgi:predicted DNA-binding transcriptional regulator AlpA
MTNKTELPETGLVRLSTILAVIPVSKSTFYAWIAAGKVPRPVRLGSRISAWRVEDIRALLNGARDD